MAEVGPPPGFAHFVSLRLPPARGRYLRPGKAGSAVSHEQAAVVGGVRALLRAEGAVVLGVALTAYAQFGAGWGVFALWLLAPDLSLLGYVAGPRVGAALYNAAHSYAGPVLLLALGVFAAMPWAVAGGLIWLAHIGLDRALGYGLKYATGFAATHLGRIGRADPW
ncbi:DUF4260 domain-containing protein [Variovorax sp. Root411]|uniref:DUF4260 domain-containing protein n=1 Tax=Variovorax sp. Root411 TaxID=1736530 RepID=UPI0006FC2691|nr:DUF4260 domain-containing protein [Variovorax sp. Root411]KQW61445.1 hypothetical protein ASC92_26285 [Variovorax sp. Root411]